jgi:hypothetical protein
VQTESIVGIKGNDGFVGCGFVVTPRHILTCAHVVNAVLGTSIADRERWPEADVKVKVVFPYLGNRSLEASVVYWKPQRFEQIPSTRIDIEEDIAGLELLNGELPALPVELRSASSDQAFKVFGYPKKTSQGGVAEGKIQADLPCGWFQLDGTCPQGLWAERGYSGSAIWSKQDSCVYGMMVARRLDDTTKIAYMIPFQGLENAIAHLCLLEQIPQPSNDEPNLWQLYLSIYQRCCPADWEQSYSLPKTLAEILAQLNDMGSTTVDGLEEPVERKCIFVAQLLIKSGSLLTEPQKEGLRVWVRKVMENFPNLIDALQSSQSVELERSVQVQDPCLVVQVSPNLQPYATQAFFIPDTHSYQPDDVNTWHEVFCWDFEKRKEMSEELEPIQAGGSVEIIERKLKSRLAGYIMTCKKRYLSRCEGTFRIELILPLALMNQPIECWELEVGGYEGSLVPASSFPLVIRSYDRITDEYQEELGEQWHSRWNHLKTHDAQQALAHLKAVPANIRVPQLNAAYGQDRTVGIKISEVLQQGNERNLMGAILGTATPVAVWLRCAPPAVDSSVSVGENTDQVLNVLDEFLTCCLDKIPSDALTVRAQAIASSIEPDETNFMVGHHLSLLLENPHLLPPSAPKQATE